jgi:hypothetical protein
MTDRDCGTQHLGHTADVIVPRRDGSRAVRTQIDEHVGAAICAAMDRSQRRRQLVDGRAARGRITN